MMLVVGAGGFVGSAVMRAAVDAGEPVAGLVRRPRPNGDETVSEPSERFVVGDARLPDLGLDRATAAELRRSVTTVVVASGRASLAAGLSELRRDHLAPLAGSLAFARRVADLRRLVLVSSVVAAGSDGPSLRSDHAPAARPPRTHYEYVKAEEERVVRASGLPWSVVRAGHVMAAEDGDHRPPVPVGLFELLPHLAASAPVLVDPAMTYWSVPVDFLARVVVEVAGQGRRAVWAVDPASPPMSRLLDVLAVRHGLRSRRIVPATLARAVAELVPPRWWGVSTPPAFRQYAGASWDLDLRCLTELLAAGVRPPRSLEYVDRTIDHEVERIGRLGRSGVPAR